MTSFGQPQAKKLRIASSSLPVFSSPVQQIVAVDPGEEIIGIPEGTYEFVLSTADELSYLIQNDEDQSTVYELAMQPDEIIEEQTFIEEPIVTQVVQEPVKLPPAKKTKNADKSPTKSAAVKSDCDRKGCKLAKVVYDSGVAFRCEICDKHYTFPQKEVEPKFNYCVTCLKTFHSVAELDNHVLSHCFCDTCNVECSTMELLNKHKKLHKSPLKMYPFKCHKCDCVYKTKAQVKEHAVKEHPIIFKHVTSTLKPIKLTKISSDKLDWKCPHCSISFTNEIDYNNHIKTHRVLTNTSEIKAKRKFSCKTCGLELDSMCNLDSHMRSHGKPKTLNERKCNLCNRIFETEQLYVAHMQEHLDKAKRCHLCSKIFVNKSSLMAHLKTHSS